MEKWGIIGERKIEKEWVIGEIREKGGEVV